MELDCKHVAAVLLHVLEGPEQWFAPVFQADFLGGHFPPALPSGAAPAPQLDHRWDSWLLRLDQVAAASDSGDADRLASGNDVPERIIYLLKPQQGRLKVELAVARQLKNGGWGQPQSYQFSNVLYNQPPARFVQPLDVELVRRLMLAQGAFNTYELFLEGSQGTEVLKNILATGRCPLAGQRQTTSDFDARRDATSHAGLGRRPARSPVSRIQGHTAGYGHSADVTALVRG